MNAARVVLWAALALVGSPPCAAAAAPQDAPRTPAEGAAEIERLIDLARSGKPVVRPQAAEQLVALGAPAAERLTALAASSLADLGPELVAVLADFGDERLRAHLWRGLGDGDFPWRPAAAGALSAAPREAERERFARAGGDVLAPVRAAAMTALGVLRPPADARARADEERLLRAALGDADDRVRRAAALALAARDVPCALLVLAEDLTRVDRFFSMQTGLQARLAAHKALAALHPELFPADFRPGAPPEAATIERVRATLAEACTEPDFVLPPAARAGGAEIDAVFGVEVRSCRAGEFFLRFTADDTLWVGTGNPARVALEAGSVARLASRLADPLAGLDARLYGEPGCDLEQFHARGSDGRTPSWIVAKGPAPAGDLRPPGLDAFALAVLELVPAGPSDDPRLDDLRARLRAAFGAVGGDPASGTR